MVGTETERPLSPTATLWFPGRTIYPVTARAQEIAKSREELIGLLRGVPESDYELSLTDLVEKRSDLDDSVAEDKKRVVVVEDAKNRKPKKRSESESESKSKSKSRSSSSRTGGGVLLKLFMPVSLTRTLTRSVSSVSVRTPLDSDSSKRESERAPSAQPGCCWSLSWERGGRSGQSRRQSAKVD